MKTRSSFTQPLRGWLGLVWPTVVIALLTSVIILRADVPRPHISQFKRNPDGSVLLRWDATAESAYRVLTSTNLGDGSWTPVDYLVAASNSVTWQANGQSGTTRFYKLATDGIAILNVEPSIVSTGAVVDVYVIGQGFGSNDVLRLIGPGGPLTLTNRIVIKPTLMKFTAGPTFTPDLPGTYDLEVTSGTTGQKATLKFAWSVVSAPAGSQALLEPPRPPPASPDVNALFGVVVGINNTKPSPPMPSLARGIIVIKPGVGVTPSSAMTSVAGGNETDKDCGGYAIARDCTASCKVNVSTDGRSVSGGGNVMPFSGEVQLQEADMVIPGRGLDFIWARTYRSRYQTNRWTHSYDVSVAQTTDGIVVADGTGRSDVYHPGTNGVYSRPEFFNEGRLSNSVFTLTFPDTGRWVFNPFDTSASAGKLAQIIDRNGNTMSLAYDTFGRLSEIVDDLGRTNHVAYNTNGQLASVTDFAGRNNRYNYYLGSSTGGSAGDLKSVTSPSVTNTPNGNDFPDGKTITYTYSTGYSNDAENHLLLSVIDGKGQTVRQFAYEHNPADFAFLRCIAEQEGTNTPARFTYLPVTASPSNNYRTLTATCNDPMGNVSECSYDSRNRCVFERDFTGRATPGVPVTATVNRPAGKVHADDPDYFDTQWSWNQDSLCVQETEPLGNSVSCVYESDYDKNASPRNKGNLRLGRAISTGDLDGDGLLDELVTRIDYVPGFGSPGKYARVKVQFHWDREGKAGDSARKGWDGTIKGNMRGQNPSRVAVALDNSVWVGNRGWDGTIKGNVRGQNGSNLLLGKSACDFVTSVTDPLGHATTANYDAHGNLTRCTGPFIVGNDSPKVDFAYNTYGQLTSVTNAADGNGYRSVDTLSFYTSGQQKGFLQTCTEDAGSLAITSSFEYDPVGNVTRIVDPRGNDTLYAYNALNQLVQSSSPPLTGSSGSYRISEQYTYDAADNLTQCDVENRDVTGALDAANPQWTTLYSYDKIKRCLQIEMERRTGGFFVTTQYQYDDNNNVVLFRSGEAVNGNDPNKVEQYVYDERNLLFQCVRAPGTTIASTNGFDYDPNGKIKKVNAELYVETMSHDGFNRLVSITDPMGNVITNRYDANGNVISSTLLGEINDVAGAAGNQLLSQITNRYDALDRCVETRVSHLSLPSLAPVGDGLSLTTFTYAPNGDCLTVTDDNGHTTSFAYDTAGRPVSESSPAGKTLTVTYRDLADNVTATIRTDLSDLGGPPQIFSRTNVYDSLNRLTQTSDNVGNTETFAYDSRDNLVRHVDARGTLTGMTYDGLSRCTATIIDLNGDGVLDFAADAGSQTAFDDNDCVIGSTDDNTNSTAFTYDAKNRCVNSTLADGTHRTFIYDSRDNVVQTLDANGTAVTFTYDLNNRCTRKDIATGAGSEVANTTTFETFAFDGCSRLTLVSNNVSRLTYAYDSLGNCTTNTQDGLTTTRTFDSVGNCLSMIYPGGRKVVYTYDALDQISSVGSAANAALPPATLASYSYDGDGRLTRITRANGINTRINWDGLLGVANVTGDLGWQQVSRINHAAAAGSPVIDQRRFAYDQNGNKILRAQLTEFSVGNGLLTNSWSYDPINQLSRAINTKGTGAVARGYYLDSEGNRIAVTNGLALELYTRDATIPPADFQVNQYTTTPFDSELHDDNGNLVQASSSASQTLYVYDYADRLVEVSDLTSGSPVPVVSFTYDALGNRISKTTYPPMPSAPATTYYCKSREVCGNGIKDIETRTGGPGGGVIHVYCWGETSAAGRGKEWAAEKLTDLAFRFTATGEPQYYHSDDLGNTLALTDASGNVLERNEYDDYGAPTFLTSDGVPTSATSSTFGNPFLFHGMFWDGETGLYAAGFEKGWPCRYEGPRIDAESGRYFDPKTGRYLIRSGVESSFSFAGNNPWSSPAGRSKQSEAKANTKAMFTAEKAFYAEKDRMASGGGFANNNPWSGLIKFQARSKQSEAKSNSKAMFTAQKAFYAEKDRMMGGGYGGGGGAATIHWRLEIRVQRVEMK